MNKKGVKIAALALAGVIACTNYPVSSATGIATLFPAAGFALAIGDGVPISEVIARADAVESADPTKIQVNTKLELASGQTSKQTVQSNLNTEVLEEEAEVSTDVPVINKAIETDIDNTDEVSKAPEAEEIVPEEVTVSEVTVSEEIASEEIAAEEVISEEADATSTEDNTVAPETEAESSEAVEMVTAVTKPAATAVKEAAVNETVSANEAVVVEETVSANEVEQDFKSLVIAQVNDYVNVRAQASEESEIIGKLYDDSVGTLITEENGWYKIQSGSVEGYVKAEYCVTGEAAEALVDEVGEKIATVTTTTLKVRKEPGTDAEVLGLVPIEEELSVLGEADGWVKVSIEEGEGYVSSEYVSLRVDFVEAESKAEEEARLRKEEEERQAARAAANARLAEQAAAASQATTQAAPVTTAAGSAAGQAVVDYALQFVGNPYVYGGTSLTNGADCSGFVMSVYAHFGVSLPHSSAADRHVGYDVGGLENAQPGDLVCYSGHVALYIGNGQIVHASSSKTGIIVSRAGYRQVLAVRRIF